MKTLSFLLLFFTISSCTIFKGQKMTKTELFFGLSKSNGEIISNQDWQAFADSVIAKTFSEGSTLIDARGQWRNEDGKIISEPSKVLILISRISTARSKQIDLVREKYKKYFQQSSVLRVDGLVSAEF